MISLRSNAGRHVPSELTDQEKARNEFTARQRLYLAGHAVVIPLDHPSVKGAFRAIVEGFGETEYGKRQSGGAST